MESGEWGVASCELLVPNEVVCVQPFVVRGPLSVVYCPTSVVNRLLSIVRSLTKFLKITQKVIFAELYVLFSLLKQINQKNK